MEAGWIVQDPPYNGHFNSLMLNWSNGTAYNKSSRLNDFFLGEGSCYKILAPEWLLKHGIGGCVAIDGMHGTQKYKYPLYTFMVFDEYEHEHPTVFGFLEREETEDLVELLSVVKKMIQHYIPRWMLSWTTQSNKDNV